MYLPRTLLAIYINSKNFCCFTQTNTPTQQLRNESSESNSEIAEMRRQIADLQTGFRGERLQRENLVACTYY